MSLGPDPMITLNSGTSTPILQLSNGSFKSKGIVVFSGGSAANNLVDVFKTVRENKKCPLSYVIPISDNGGSSSEVSPYASIRATTYSNRTSSSAFLGDQVCIPFRFD